MKNQFRYTIAATAGLIAVLIVQSVHMLEHVAQVIQKFALGQPEAHGLFGAIFDFEWVHFIYNTSLEVVLVLMFIWWHRFSARNLPLSLRAAVWLQGYHVVEHTVKMYQYLVGGIASPKGILGFVFPLIWLHFWINLLVLALIVILIVGDWEAMGAHSGPAGSEGLSLVR